MTWEHISKPLSRALRKMAEEMERADAEQEKLERKKKPSKDMVLHGVVRR